MRLPVIILILQMSHHYIFGKKMFKIKQKFYFLENVKHNIFKVTKWLPVVLGNL